MALRALIARSQLSAIPPTPGRPGLRKELWTPSEFRLLSHESYLSVPAPLSTHPHTRMRETRKLCDVSPMPLTAWGPTSGAGVPRVRGTF